MLGIERRRGGEQVNASFGYRLNIMGDIQRIKRYAPEVTLHPVLRSGRNAPTNYICNF